MGIVFGTGGFRAVIGEDYTKENVSLVCQAISNLIIKNNKKKEVCIGYDNRFMSENFARWCAEIFACNDIKVELFDSATPTPVAMFATKVNHNDYGLMITASHNPHIYNGVKVFTQEGKDADIEQTQEIEKEFNSISSLPTFESKFEHNITYKNYVNEYITSLVDLLEINNLNSNISIVCDTKHGSTARELKLMFEKMGLNNYKILNEKRDAFFDFVMPAPFEEFTDEIKDFVKENNSDIGFVLDEDGDRLAIIDEKGRYIDNNYILPILYYFLVKHCGKKGDSIKNVATSNLLDIVTEKCGGVCHEMPVGFKFISSGLIEYNAVIGGESSGGSCIKEHILGKDSLLAIALCIKAMVVMKKSFGDIYDEVLAFADNYIKICRDRQYFYTPEQKTHIDHIINERITPEHRYELDRIEYSEYIKIYYKNGNWALIRFSGTEPVLRLFAETDSAEESIQVIEDWEKLLEIDFVK